MMTMAASVNGLLTMGQTLNATLQRPRLITSSQPLWEGCYWLCLTASFNNLFNEYGQKNSNGPGTVFGTGDTAGNNTACRLQSSGRGN